MGLSDKTYLPAIIPARVMSAPRGPKNRPPDLPVLPDEGDAPADLEAILLSGIGQSIIRMGGGPQYMVRVKLRRHWIEKPRSFNLSWKESLWQWASELIGIFPGYTPHLGADGDLLTLSLLAEGWSFTKLSPTKLRTPVDVQLYAEIPMDIARQFVDEVARAVEARCLRLG